MKSDKRFYASFSSEDPKRLNKKGLLVLVKEKLQQVKIRKTFNQPFYIFYIDNIFCLCGPSPRRDNVALLTVVDVLSTKTPSAGKPAVVGGADSSEERYEERYEECGKSENRKRRYRQGGGDRARAAATAVAGGFAAPTASSLPFSGDDGGPSSSPPAVEAGVARLVIANTHLIFNPKRGDVKTAQLMMLTERVERWVWAELAQVRRCCWEWFTLRKMLGGGGLGGLLCVMFWQTGHLNAPPNVCFVIGLRIVADINVYKAL